MTVIENAAISDSLVKIVASAIATSFPGSLLSSLYQFYVIFSFTAHSRLVPFRCGKANGPAQTCANQEPTLFLTRPSLSFTNVLQLLTNPRILLLIIVSSYIPQLQLIFARNSTAGITKSYVLFTYLFTATQFILVMIYSSYGRPIADCIKDGELTGMDAYSVVVGPVQMTVLWLGSLFL